MEDKIFIRVLKVNFSDLPDWSNPQIKYHNMSEMNCNEDQPALKRIGTRVECNDIVIALFRVHSNVYAIQDKCPHLGGPLHLGDIEDMPGEGFCVRCPWHKWCFGLDSGKVIFPPGRKECALTFPVKVEPDGTIYIGFEKFSDSYFDTNGDF